MTPSEIKTFMVQLHSPLVLSDWYELVAGDQLMQGDIIENCPVFRPPTNLPWPLPTESDEFGFDGGALDVIIKTQSCDLAPGQKSDMMLVILCPIWKLSEASQVNQFLASNYGKEECRRGAMTGYHILSGCEHGDWSREVSIVIFREVLSLPWLFLKRWRQAVDYGPGCAPPTGNISPRRSPDILCGWDSRWIFLLSKVTRQKVSY